MFTASQCFHTVSPHPLLSKHCHTQQSDPETEPDQHLTHSQLLTERRRVERVLYMSLHHVLAPKNPEIFCPGQIITSLKDESPRNICSRRNICFGTGGQFRPQK